MPAFLISCNWSVVNIYVQESKHRPCHLFLRMSSQSFRSSTSETRIVCVAITPHLDRRKNSIGNNHKERLLRFCSAANLAPSNTNVVAPTETQPRQVDRQSRQMIRKPSSTQ